MRIYWQRIIGAALLPFMLAFFTLRTGGACLTASHACEAASLAVLASYQCSALGSEAPTSDHEPFSDEHHCGHGSAPDHRPLCGCQLDPPSLVRRLGAPAGLRLVVLPGAVPGRRDPVRLPSCVIASQRAAGSTPLPANTAPPSRPVRAPPSC